MSPAERLFRQRLERRAALLQPDLQRAIFRAFARIRAQLTPSQLEVFVRTPDVERLFLDVVSESDLERAFEPVRLALRDGVEDAGASAAKDLPGLARGVRFNVLSPVVIDAIRQLDTRVIQTLKDDIREAVRVAVEEGLRAGVNPREVARGLRSVIGLAPNQVQAVANFERMLREGDTEALTRALRDRSFDRKIRRAFAPGGGGLSEADVQRMTSIYRRRMVAFNAETNARTAALDANKLAHQLTWESAVQRGDIDPAKLWKRWIGVKDDRERPTHLAMEGETVRWDERYSNGQMVPGDDEFNCFPAGTVVSGSFVAGLKANYSGPLREIVTARGHRLTLTPNHPILTPDGWVAAAQLDKGRALFSYADKIGRVATRSDAHDQDGPARIEQVFQSIGAHGASALRRYSRDNLHGDAQWLQGEVNVVWADGQLLDATDSCMDGVDNRTFHAPTVDQSGLPCAGPLNLDGQTVALAPSGSMSRGHLELGPVGIAALGRGPLQPLRLGTASDWHAPLAEPSKQDDTLIAAFIRQLLETGAGAVSLDEIVEVRDFKALTHVYDLQSEDGWMIAQGIVCSNCRCVSYFFTSGKDARRSGVGSTNLETVRKAVA